MDLLDFWSIYISGSIQILAGFYFFLLFLHQKGKMMHYFVFDAIGIAVLSLFPAGSVTAYCTYVLLLAAGGSWIAARSAEEGRRLFSIRFGLLENILYAAVTTIIMMLSFGMMKALLTSLMMQKVLYFFVPYASVSKPALIGGILFMALSDGVALAFSFCCYYIVYHYFSGSLFMEKVGRTGKWYFSFVLAPDLLIFLLGESINSVVYGNCVVTEADGIMKNVISGAADMPGSIHCRIFFLQALGIVSLFFILYACRRFREDTCLRKRLSALEQALTYRKQYVEEAKSRYDKTRSIRHDIKNHTLVLKELLHAKQPEKALHYLGEMEMMEEEMFFSCHTNVPVLDALLGDKLGAAKKKGIEVDCSLHLPDSCKVSDMDLCTIFFNALDNAVHACEKVEEGREKYIYVSGKRQGDFILLQIEKLKAEKQQLEQKIRRASGEEESAEWERKLAQVENELRQKDNDIYRRQHTVFRHDS